MKIRFKTGGIYLEHLPPGTPGNTAEIDVPEGATPLDVMRQLHLPLDENYLVSLNGEVVVVSERDTTTLSENDHLAVMPPLRGG